MVYFHVPLRVCPKLRRCGGWQAQLRAAVYTAIDEQERQRGVHLEDPRVSELKEDATCRMATDLVIEFLTFYNLDAALSCLLPEISFVRALSAVV